jgi:CRP/FNR family transcriptional regulator, cyclic AMP receptor protein
MGLEQSSSERPRTRLCRVLDVDPDLAGDLDGDALRVARTRAVAAVLVLDPGPCDLRHRRPETSLDALLLLDGTLTREVRVLGRIFTELLGPGDVLRPWGREDVELVPCDVEWHALTRATLALVDAPFHERVRPWPQIAGALVERGVRRAHRLALQRALSCHKRLEDRILMLFWHLAERWGRVGPDSTMLLRLPLTHRLIGEIVGAERPSVSATLGRLAAAGKLDRAGADWVLHGTVSEHFGDGADEPHEAGGNGAHPVGAAALS